jgi:hypothetical protein
MNRKNNVGNKMFNLIALCVMALFLAAAPAMSLTDNTIQGSVISVTLLNQDPDPVEPGSYVEIRWKVENFGDGDANNFTVELLPSFPFSLDANEDAVKSMGTIKGLQADEWQHTVKYKVRVSNDAVEGVNTVKLKYSYMDSRNVRQQSTKEFDVEVRTLDATLGIDSITITPSVLEPGKNGQVQIKVKNLADSTLKQVSVRLDLTLASLASATSASSALLDVLPFANVGSATEKKVAYLNPSSEAIFSYDLVVYPDAVSRVYKVPIIITFYDEQGTSYVKTDLVGIVVGSRPELEVVLDSYDFTLPGTSGRATVKFINKGVSNIKFVTVKVLEDNDHKLLSADTDYVGNIESDDFQTSDFKVYVEPTAGQKVSIPLEVTYKDANNNDYKKNITLYANLYSNQQAKELGIQSSSKWPWYLGAIVVVVIGFFVIRGMRKKKTSSK